MDHANLELMRIPFATVLFLFSVFFLSTYFSKPELNTTLGTLGAFVCIGILVYSFVLYSNLDVPLYKH